MRPIAWHLPKLEESTKRKRPMDLKSHLKTQTTGFCTLLVLTVRLCSPLPNRGYTLHLEYTWLSGSIVDAARRKDSEVVVKFQSSLFKTQIIEGNSP